jgi:hypothetical protein
VRTCETTGDEATVTVSVWPYELTYEMTLLDGTNEAVETDETTDPDSVMTGVLHAGAGV